MNDYTRRATVSIEELVPDREQLPLRQAWRKDGSNCTNTARYTQDGHPVCGMHVVKPQTIWSTWK